MATDRDRYMISVDNETFEGIENYRFTERCQTRSAATLDLIVYALKAYEKDKDKFRKEIAKIKQEKE